MRINYLQQKEWSDSHSLVWKEIVSRFGQSEYDDEARRTIHTATLKAEYDAKAYARSRKEEYPALGDQLDMIYHNGDGGVTFQAAIKAVKDKYPKE